MSGVSSRATRLLGEFSLIVTGVLVALVADDYRQGIETREATVSAIRLLIADLEEDSIELDRVLGYAPGSGRDVRLLLRMADRPEFPTDSAHSAIRSLRISTMYNPVRATFDLVVQQDRLRHIGDFDLQAEVMRYYEVHQDQAVLWGQQSWDTQRAYVDQYNRFMMPQADSDEQALDRHWQFMPTRLTASWDEIRRDNLFMNTLFWRYTVGSILENQISETLEANSALRDRLRTLIPAGE